MSECEASICIWNRTDLEYLNKCPVCHSLNYKVFLEGVIDNTFFTTSKKWNLLKCFDCESCFLNPRPNEISISKAYSRYYTHPGFKKDYVGGFARLKFNGLREKIKGSYKKNRFGSLELSASFFYFFIVCVTPFYRNKIESKYRSLPNIPRPRKVLDVGCGNGDFLVSAKALGWEVYGIEPDLLAANSARNRGVEVLCGTVNDFLVQGEAFDVITISHVVEHLHSPRLILERCYNLLKPGGFLWLETPNSSSFGIDFFKHSWRGVEAPRHLVLFSNKSINSLLYAAGFNRIERNCDPGHCEDIFSKSYKISVGLSPYSDVKVPFKIKFIAKFYSLVSFFMPRKREFLSFRAYKPVCKVDYETRN